MKEKKKRVLRPFGSSRHCFSHGYSGGLTVHGEACFGQIIAEGVVTPVYR